MVCPLTIYLTLVDHLPLIAHGDTVYCPVTFSLLEMTTIATIKLLVKEIGVLSNSLSGAVPKGSKDDKIWSIMDTDECDTPHETFNRRFNALFAEDCRDSNGCLHHVRQGKLGMGLVVSYLLKINWTSFPLDLVELKLQRLITELKHLQYVSYLVVCQPY